MGGAFDARTRTFDCNGQQVTNKLNQVFRNPGTPQYQKAQGVSQFFGDITNTNNDNWKDLLIAYLRAGVDVGDEFPAWVAYLEALGTGPQGPQNIYAIAQARFTALTSNPPQGMFTHTHRGGGVHTAPGSGSGPGAQPADIDSPCPLV